MEMEDDSRDSSDTDYNFLSRPNLRSSNRALNYEQDDNYADEMNIERPSTPTNRSDGASDFCLTPLPSMECDDVSYLKLYEVDGNMNKSSLTSTPLVSSKHSRSLPIPSPFNRMLSAGTRHCRSVESLRLYRIGSEELPLEYMNPFTPDGKLLLNKANAQRQLKR